MKQGKQQATITDIAIAAGVSKTTVSRYINGKHEMMSQKTQDRIKAVIDMLDYQPSSAARSLRSKKSRQIGVILAEMDTPFSTALEVGISRALQEYGYAPLFVDAGNDAQRERDLTDAFLRQQVDGLLVNTVNSDNPNLIRAACEGVPIVLCDRYVEHYQFSIVALEQRQAFYNMVELLKQEGYHRPVLFIQPSAGNSTRRRRKEAFLEAVQGLYGYDASNDIYVVDKTGGKSAGEQLDYMLESLQPGEKPAIFGGNNVVTVQAFSAIAERHLSIPNDIGLCGPEDWDMDNELNLMTLLQPNLTSMYVPTREMGRKAAELLLRIINGESTQPEEILLPCALRVRASTSLRKDAAWR